MTVCAFITCAEGAEFLVDHDEMGKITVCSVHARNAVDAGVAEVVRCA